ncbi:MAG: gamma-glutamylcyclotransferase family protein [Rhodobacterales bacterium]
MKRRAGAWLAGAVLLVALLLMVWIWPVYLPPVTPAMEEAREQAQAVPDDGPHRVFGYATLTNPVVRLIVVGQPVPSSAARLPDMQREGRDIFPAPGAVLEGRVFETDDNGLLRLDRYERLGERYRRDVMTLSDGSAAWVYRLLPYNSP